jgi:exodeoxyribonuclease-5
MTAHKLLYYSDEQPDGTFIHTPRRKLEKKYKLVVCDEASMLPQNMIDLLLSHGVHVLFLGDNEQLPPIDGDQTILNAPHVFLNEITRQALDNPIIKLSMDIRDGKPFTYGGDKRCKIIPKNKVSNSLLLGADQIIVGTNKTRHEKNEQLRQLKWGDKYSEEPLEGDKCICLKNDWNTIGSNDDPLINGQIGVIKNIRITEMNPYGKVIFADFLSDDGGVYKNLMIDYNLMVNGTSTITSENWRKFAGWPKPYQFAYAYAITCHKSQGSEFDKVLVFDEAFGDAEQKRRWRYTAVTRSSNKLIVVV